MNSESRTAGAPGPQPGPQPDSHPNQPTACGTADDALRASEERYRSLFDGMAQCVAVLECLCDEDGVPRDSRFLDVNPAFEQLVGRTRDDIVGRLGSDVLPANAERLASVCGSVSRTGEPVRTEHRSPASGRHYDVVAFRPAAGQAAIVFHDITARKRLEDEQRVLLAKYSVLFDAFPVGVSITDSAGNVVEVNKTAARVLGVPAQSLQTHRVGSPQWRIVRSDGSLMPPEELASVRAMKEQRVIEDVETGVVRPGEEEIWVSVCAAPLPLEGYGLVITYGDISRRRQAERALAQSQADLRLANEELRRANEALQASNESLEARVAARTAELFTRTVLLRDLALELTRAEERERQRVAHVIHDDIQQLLSVARMSLGSAIQHASDDAVRESLSEADGLIASSLSITRSLTAELTPAILYRSGLSPALRWLGRWYHERLNLDVTVEAEANADADLEEELRVTLFRAVRELLFNVVKHARAADARVTLDRLPDGRLRIVVSDEGIGFDPGSVQSRDGMDESFGLFSLRERLSLLGGQLDVTSVPGHGTSFTILGPPPDPARQPAPPPSPDLDATLPRPHPGTRRKRRPRPLDL